jgi:hypothetical protein
MLSPILTFFVVSLVAVDLIEEVVVPVASSAVEYSADAYQWGKDQALELTE